MKQYIFSLLLVIITFSIPTLPAYGSEIEDDDPTYELFNNGGVLFKLTKLGITPESAELLSVYKSYGGDKRIHSRHESLSRPIIAIADTAFRNCVNLKSMKLPCTLISSGASAFEGCSSLTSISIDSLVSTIGNEAFKDCAQLTEIYSYKETPPVCGEDVFLGVPVGECTLYVPFNTSETYRQAAGWNQIGTIVERQRFTVDSITYCVTDNGEVEAIWGECAYDKYRDLMYTPEGRRTDVHFTLPASVSYNEKEYKVASIAPWAFDGVSSDFITIPGNVETIGNYAFYGTIANSVTIEEGVKHIGNWAFAAYFETSLIKSITIANSVETIGDYAFADCDYLTSLELGNGVKRIGMCAFRHASQLKSITMPASIEEIGEKAFSSPHPHIQSMQLGEGLLSIKEGMFENYPFAIIVYLPNSLETIEDRAFLSLPTREYLETITFPENVRSLGEEIFLGCGRLKDLHVLALQPPLCKEGTFDGISPRDINLHVPEESLDLYKAAVGWKEFFETISTEEAMSNSFTAYIQNGIIVAEGLKAGETLSLYSSSGALLLNIAASEGQTKLPLPSVRGVYIISNGKEKVKMIL